MDSGHCFSGYVDVNFIITKLVSNFHVADIYWALMGLKVGPDTMGSLTNPVLVIIFWAYATLSSMILLSKLALGVRLTSKEYKKQKL